MSWTVTKAIGKGGNTPHAYNIYNYNPYEKNIRMQGDGGGGGEDHSTQREGELSSIIFVFLKSLMEKNLLNKKRALSFIIFEFLKSLMEKSFEEKGW